MLVNSKDRWESLMAEEPISHGSISQFHASVTREVFARTLGVLYIRLVVHTSCPDHQRNLRSTWPFATNMFQELAQTPCLPKSRTAS
jgi:hypothetical protein